MSDELVVSEALFTLSNGRGYWTHLVVISGILLVVRVGEAHSCRRLHIQHVGNLVPAELVLIQRGPVVIHLRQKANSYLDSLGSFGAVTVEHNCCMLT